MTFRGMFVTVAAVAAMSCREPATPPQPAAAPRRPNLVFVLVDYELTSLIGRPEAKELLATIPAELQRLLDATK